MAGKINTNRCGEAISAIKRDLDKGGAKDRAVGIATAAVTAVLTTRVADKDAQAVEQITGSKDKVECSFEHKGRTLNVVIGEYEGNAAYVAQGSAGVSVWGLLRADD